MYLHSGEFCRPKLAPKGPLCYFPTERETMPQLRYALDLFVCGWSKIVSGSARGGVIRRFGKHTESQFPWYKWGVELMGLPSCISSPQDINNSWFEIIIPGLVRKYLGVFRAGVNVQWKWTRNPAYEKCSGVVQGQGDLIRFTPPGSVRSAPAMRQWDLGLILAWIFCGLNNTPQVSAKACGFGVHSIWAQIPALHLQTIRNG